MFTSCDKCYKNFTDTVKWYELDGKHLCAECCQINELEKIADLLEKQNILLDKLLKTEETHK